MYLSGNDNLLHGSCHQFAGVYELLLTERGVNAWRQDLGTGNEGLGSQSCLFGSHYDLVLERLVFTVSCHIP